jgi:hypothetical protein
VGRVFVQVSVLCAVVREGVFCERVCNYKAWHEHHWQDLCLRCSQDTVMCTVHVTSESTILQPSTQGRDAAEACATSMSIVSSRSWNLSLPPRHIHWRNQA